MRIYYDTEFLEDGSTIELISIGLVSEDDREYYAVSSDMPFKRIMKHDWLVRNVVPSLPLVNRQSLVKYLAHPPNRYPKPTLKLVDLDTSDTCVKPLWVIANEVRDFLQAVEDAALWAWYGAYDHVRLCQLWGPMASLPDGVPMWTNDLKQECVRLGDPPMPKQDVGVHNALADAWHNKTKAEFLARFELAGRHIGGARAGEDAASS